MNSTYFNLSEQTQVASAKDCTVHLHFDDQRRPVFSVGNEDVGATEFKSYNEALDALQSEGLNEEDCAERAGAALGENALDVIHKASKQSKSVCALEAALLDLQRLPHPRRAAGGFAVALVGYLEKGLAK